MVVQLMKVQHMNKYSFENVLWSAHAFFNVKQLIFSISFQFVLIKQGSVIIKLIKEMI